MAGTNKIVTKTVNRTVFEVDRGSYNKTLKQIKSIKKEWESAQSPSQSTTRKVSAGYSKSANEMKLINKRLEETRRREEAKSTAHSIALAKKEAKAKEAIQKQSAARIKQTMRQMTAANPESARMREFYKKQEAAARKASRGMSSRSLPRGPMNIRSINSVPLPPRGGRGTGMVGNANSVWSPDTVSRQNAQMGSRIREESKIRDAQSKIKEREARRNAIKSARVNDIMAQQRIRLSSKYGSNYHSSLGRGANGDGIQDLNKKFRQGTLSVGQYRQSIQALERQFKSAQGSAMGLGGVLESVRSNLVGIGAAYGVFNTGASILKQGQFFQGMDATMLMVSDSSEEAGKRIKFVKDQSYRLGLDLKEAAQGYTQMSIASEGVLSKTQNNDLFKSFSEYSTALQVDPVKYQRGITAIQQMMGKGQIMAEELKQQLAEGIPGSLQVFVKASQEAFNDTSIDVEKLMDMMQKGELKAAKVLPFVAKYYAEAARRGGALDKALKSNRVAMQQLQMTWMNFQNQVFEGGFGEQMTKVFRDLASMMSSNGELAKNLGKFFGLMIEGFWDMVLYVHDAFVFLDRVIGFYMEKLGVQSEKLGDMFDWGAYAFGVVIFANSLGKVFSILYKIAGLAGALGAVKAAVGGLPGVPTGTTNAGKTGLPNATTSKSGSTLSKISKLGKIAKIGALAELYTAGGVFYDRNLKRGDDIIAESGQSVPSWMPKPVGFLDAVDEWNQVRASDRAVPLQSPTFTPPTAAAAYNPMMSRQAGAGIPSWVGEPLNVNVKVNDGKVKDLIEVGIEDNNRKAYNMMLGGGPG